MNEDTTITTHQDMSVDLNVLALRDVEKLVPAIDEAIASNDWLLANSLIQQALTVLGDKYVYQAAIDDTRMALVLASSEERSGNLERAVNIRLRVLKTRLSLLRQKLGLSR